MTGEIAFQYQDVFREEVEFLGKDQLTAIVAEILLAHALREGWVLGDIETRVEDIDMPVFDELGVIIMDEVIPITRFTAEAPILRKTH